MSQKNIHRAFSPSVGRYARHTERAKAVLLELVHASNGEMATKVARLLGFITSPDTLIRRQRGESFTLPSPRALGLDEFALRRRRTYATLLVDLERHRPIDLFEGLSAAPFTRWLQDHSQVEVLARDRAWAYAQAGRIAAPQALQVSDRFHLVYNVGKAFKELLHARRWQVPEQIRRDDVVVKERRATPAKQARWAAVQQWKDAGASISQRHRSRTGHEPSDSQQVFGSRAATAARRPTSRSIESPAVSSPSEKALD